MITFKCKMCGGDLHPEENATTCECEYCGSVQTIPTADNEKKGNLFNRANRLRMAAEYDKAAAVYTSITAEFPEEAEAYWGLCLCKYGIEYVEDPVTAKKIPTCHRTRSESIMDDPDFDQACENADAVAKRVYREEAKAIDRLQQDILSVVANESPYDVFICYKETDDDGQRTEDSVLAQDIYDALTAKGLKVFFARITLEDKLGQQYEPYIYAALHSAKVMLAIGTQFEYFDAVWVKNEWSRFLDMMKSDKSKTLIPCYKDIDAYDMPREFKNLQAQDMGKLGWLQDLTRGVMKLCGRDERQPEAIVVQQVGSTIDTNNIDTLLMRVRMFMRDGEWPKASGYIERVLDINPRCSEAYLYRLMVSYECANETELEKKGLDISKDKDFLYACEFSDDAQHKKLESLKERCAEMKKQQIMDEKIDQARELIHNANREDMVMQAIDILKDNKDHGDAANLMEQTKQKLIELNKKRETYACMRSRVNECRKLFDISYSTNYMVYIMQDQTLGFYNLLHWKSAQELSMINIEKLYVFARSLTGVRAVSFNRGIACIMNDGSVQSYYEGDRDYKTNTRISNCWDTSNWRDIVSVTEQVNKNGNIYLFGLCADGKVLVTGQDVKTVFPYLSELNGVAHILEAPCGDPGILYIGKDGNVYRCSCKTGGEPVLEENRTKRYVVEIEGNMNLCGDGTVYFSCEDKYGTESPYLEDSFKEYFGNPQDCIAIAKGYSDFRAYLTADGIVHGRSIIARFTWNNIAAIKGDDKLVGLTNDGRLLYFGNTHGKEVGEIPGIRLYKCFENLEEERKQAKDLKEQKRNHLQSEIEDVKRQLSNAQTELINLKGLFTGKRRKELESTIENLKERLNERQQELNVLNYARISGRTENK